MMQSKRLDMRDVVVVLALAVGAVHCAAPVEREATTAESGLGTPVEATRARPAPEEGTPPASYTGEPVHVAGLDALVKTGEKPTVTSVAKDARGSRFVTGTFRDRVTIGDTVLKSRGDKDVFLLKMEPSGALAWARSIGSEWQESAPRISVDAQTGKVTVVGMTDGAMDCGAGPLPTWDSETFFLCTFGNDDGTAIASGVFPTGLP